MQNQPSTSNGKSSIGIKLIIVCSLIVILLIPVSMIMALVKEREERRNETIKEVSSKWGNEQTIAGPILTIPYKVYLKDKNDKVIELIKYAHFLPEELNIKGDILPEIRYRGIYEVVVYRSELKFNGNFSSPDFKDLGVLGKNVVWKDAFVSVGIPDMRGIEEYIEMKWNESKFLFNPGIKVTEIINSGVSIKLPLEKKSGYNFSFSISLDGSKNLNFVPLGKETNVYLKSKWTNPSFDGAFLPDERKIDDKGFEAKWKVLNLNRNYPQQWLGKAYNIYNSVFGVNLLLPVDEYQKIMRSVKYAAMIISLTFLIFFFVEVLNKKRIHPIQYILVGLGLCIFYTLLLSISEQTNFNFAYIVSSIAVIALIAAYSKTFFKNNFLTIILGASLLIVYSFIYIILQLQDYALLMGSIGLFVILAIAMYLSRKVDWYAIDLDKEL